MNKILYAKMKILARVTAFLNKITLKIIKTFNSKFKELYFKELDVALVHAVCLKSIIKGFPDLITKQSYRMGDKATEKTSLQIKLRNNPSLDYYTFKSIFNKTCAISVV